MLCNEEKLNKNHLSEAVVIFGIQYLSGREAKKNTDYEVWQKDDQVKCNEI